jgi:uncharacterized protein YndB with AHSA1/START domain
MAQLTVHHRFAASAERVFDAWLDSETARRFLFTTVTGEVLRCDIDARIGGRYAIVDRRLGEDILHEGSYLELDRPRRIVFTLRVPRYSVDEDRITIDIKPIGQGCELTLTTQTADEWADDTKRGWMMILDVLDETLPSDASTCGAGLARHAAVPRRIAIHLAELARTLELHREMLVLDEPLSRAEDDVYRGLSGHRSQASGDCGTHGGAARSPDGGARRCEVDGSAPASVRGVRARTGRTRVSAACRSSPRRADAGLDAEEGD